LKGQKIRYKFHRTKKQGEKSKTGNPFTYWNIIGSEGGLWEGRKEKITDS
jgi:hypothetical protein